MAGTHTQATAALERSGAADYFHERTIPRITQKQVKRMYINADTIIKAASLLAALGALIGAIVSVHKTLENNKIMKLFLKNLNQLPAGEYKSFLFFFANGNPFGKEIILKIIIKQKNNQNEEMIQNIEKIKTIREILVLSENDYSDERILEELKKVNYNVEEAIPLFFE